MLYSYARIGGKTPESGMQLLRWAQVAPPVMPTESFTDNLLRPTNLYTCIVLIPHMNILN